MYVGLVLMLHRLPFHLTERVKKWVAADREQILRVQSHKALSLDEAERAALVKAAGLAGPKALHTISQQNNRERELKEALEFEALSSSTSSKVAPALYCSKALKRAEDEKQLVVVQFHHFEQRQPAKVTVGRLEL